MRITALEPQQRQADRYNLHLDGRFALALDAELVVAEGLSVGVELTEADVERLRTREDERRLLDAALHFLGPRPRSRAEVRRRLLTPKRNRPAPDPDAVERTLDRLERLGVLNDEDFAEFWVENRERFSPRAARALTQELRQRGVSRETVERVTDPERDEERAIAAGRQRLRALAGLDYATFRTQLGQFLLRRGFSYADARTAVQRLWEETCGTAADAEDEAMADDEE
jgi:regulatory protein